MQSDGRNDSSSDSNSTPTISHENNNKLSKLTTWTGQ